MEPGSKIKKIRVSKIAFDDDEDEYPGILPCHGREGGLYPGVRHQQSTCPRLDCNDSLIMRLCHLGGHFDLASKLS